MRTRAAVGFSGSAFLVASVVAVTSYGLTRSHTVAERLEADTQQAYVNARLSRSVLRSPEPDVTALIEGLAGGRGSDIVLRHRGAWFSSTLGVSDADVPPSLRRLVADGRSGHQRVRDANGDLVLVVGVPVPAVEAAYFEISSWQDLEASLDSLARALTIGTVGATIAGALIGLAWAARLVRPLAPVADAAERIAAGELDTRLDHAYDRDLRRLIDAFNSMAASLQARIDREARFSADVTHELRSPLAALAAAVEVIGRRRDEMPPTVRDAMDVLTEKVSTFQQTVLELLEMARMDAGTAELQLDVFDVRRLVERVVELHGDGAVPVEIAAGTPTHFVADRRRLAQVVENLLANARNYAGGCTRIEVSMCGRELTIAVEDDGPGVPLEERDTIFERFSRGSAGRMTGGRSGSGLGLSLAREHAQLHGGRLWVEDAAGGGARFVVALPAAAREEPAP